MVGCFSVAAGEVFYYFLAPCGRGEIFSEINHSTIHPFNCSTIFTLHFPHNFVMLSLSQAPNVILRRTSRWWKASAIPVYCECEKPKDLLKNFTVILRLSRRIPLKRLEILRASPSEWHVGCDGVLRSQGSLRMTWRTKWGTPYRIYAKTNPSTIQLFNCSTLFTLHTSLC